MLVLRTANNGGERDQIGNRSRNSRGNGRVGLFLSLAFRLRAGCACHGGSQLGACVVLAIRRHWGSEGERRRLSRVSEECTKHQRCAKCQCRLHDEGRRFVVPGFHQWAVGWGAANGGKAAFITKYSTSGTRLWTRIYGSGVVAAADQIHFVVHLGDAIYEMMTTDLTDRVKDITAPVLVIACTSEAAYHRRYQEPDKVQEDGSEIEVLPQSPPDEADDNPDVEGGQP